MSHEPTIQDVLDKVDGVAQSVQNLTHAVQGVTQSVEDVGQSVENVAEAVQHLATHMDERFDDVRSETAKEFAQMRSEMATKHDLFVVKEDVKDIRAIMATKNDLKELKNEVVTEIDRFVVLHQTLDVELVAMHSRCDRMEGFMVQVAKRLDMDYQRT